MTRVTHPAHERIDNLPRMTFRLFEGPITVADKFDAAGKKIENSISVATPLSKGDFVTFYTGSTVCTPTAMVADAATDQLLGKIVDEPVLSQNITASNATPQAAQLRKATVAVFAVAVLDVVSDGTAVTPGQALGYSAVTGTPQRFEVGTTPLAVAGGSNVVALEYGGAAAADIFAAAFGFFGTMANV